MDPIQVLLGYGVSKVAGLKKKVKWKHLEELFFKSFKIALKKQDLDTGGLFKDFRKTVTRKENRPKVLELFAAGITPDNAGNFFNTLKSKKYREGVAKRLVAEFSDTVKNEYTEIVAVIVKLCLEDYKRAFIEAMKTEEGIKLIFMEIMEISQLQETVHEIKALLEVTPVTKPKTKRVRKKKEKPKQIKILSITASPEDDLLYEKEQDTLLEAFKDFERDKVYLDMPDPVKSTLQEIEERIHDGQHDVLHISAHGGINDDKEGVLSFEDWQGGKVFVTGAQLLDSLKKSHLPQIIILSSCHSARTEPNLMPVAKSLQEAGVPVVIGMNKAITQLAAIDFTRAFFEKICDRRSTVNTAFEAGQAAILKEAKERFKKDSNWPMDENEIPRLLGDTKMTAEAFSRHRIDAPGRPQTHQFLGAKYLERGFIGRRQVLRRIFNSIERQGGALVLKGPGGIGKSTLTTRAAANLSRSGYDFIVIPNETSVEEILEKISRKAVEKKVKHAEKINAADAEPEQKLSWFLENFLFKHDTVLIFDNFELNQDEGAGGDFKAGKQRLKAFLYYFRDCLQHRRTFLMFSTRYKLPGFDARDMKIDIPEFTPTELRKMMLNSKALKRLDDKCIKTLRQEVGGNPRALELLDNIAYNEYGKREFTWEQLKEMIPEIRERIIEGGGTDDEFAPLLLDKLLEYCKEQRPILDVLALYRNPVPMEAIAHHSVAMKRQDRITLVDLSLLETTVEENKDMYYVHRLTAQYLLGEMAEETRNNRHIQAAEYFEAIRDEEGKINVMDQVEARWHFIQAGQWNPAASITFDLEDHLSLRGSTHWAMELLQELPLPKMEETNQAITHNRLGLLYQHFGDYDNALVHYQKSLEIDKKLGNEKDIAIDLHQVGMIYQYKGEYDNALEQYQQSLEIAEKIGDTKGIATSLHQVGMIYHEKGEYDSALEQYQQSLAIEEKMGNQKGIAESMHQVGMIYHEKGEYDSALEQYQQSLAIREKIGDTKGIAESLHQVGRIYHEKGEYDSALEQYQQSLEILEKIGDTKGIASSLHQVGMIYQEKGEYDSALEQYQQSLAIEEKMGNQKGIAESLHQVGRIYHEKGEYDSALEQYQQSLEIAEKIGDINGAAISLAQIGKLHFAREEYEPALKYFVQAFAIFSRIGAPYAKLAQKYINDIKEKMPPEQFEAVLKEFVVQEDG